MKKVNILVISKHPQILKIVVKLINNTTEWQAIGTDIEETAMNLFTENNINIVLFGTGITEESEAVLRTFFVQHNPAIIMIQHYGGGSGLLSNEIMQALA